MDKQKRIDKMVSIVNLSSYPCEECEHGAQKHLSNACYSCEMEALVNAGYGNLREFAEMLKKRCERNSDAVGGCGGYCVSPLEIDELLKEYFDE